jgi:transposase-like protein
MIQSITTHCCGGCGSSNIVRNGKNRYKKQQYKCKDCGKCAVLEPSVKYTEDKRKQILAAYQERPSMRGIQRVFGTSRITLSKWLKKRQKAVS